MNKNFVLIGIGVLILTGGAIFFLSQNSTPNSDTPEKGEMSQSSGSDREVPATNDNTTGDSMIGEPDRYTVYSGINFDAARDKKRVYFFHATWCPTCKAANEEFISKMSEIPEDVIVFKTDYDSSAELKKKYGITYQHTFVQVDANENQLAKWNGGGIAELKSNIK